MTAGVSAFTIYNHMYLPVSYGDPIEEYRRLTERVALWDVASQRQIEIVGPDAAALTQYLSARGLGGLKPGRARYAPICDYDGNLINDPVVLCLAEDRYWLSIADNDLGLWVKAVAAERGADVRVFEPDVSPLAIQGPLANKLAIDLFSADVVDSLGFFHHAGVELDGIELVLCRSGWSRQGGFELFLTDGSRGVELWDKVMAAGTAFGIGPGAPNLAERIESGLLSYGSDNDSRTDPFEAGLGSWVNLDSGYDFIGKEALQQRFERGIARKLVNVTFLGAPDSAGASDVSDDLRDSDPSGGSNRGVDSGGSNRGVDSGGSNASGASGASDRSGSASLLPLESPRDLTLHGDSDAAVVGELRNAVWSPRLGFHIGIALLADSAAAVGTRLMVDFDGRRIPLVVAPEPFGASRRPIFES